MLAGPPFCESKNHGLRKSRSVVEPSMALPAQPPINSLRSILAGRLQAQRGNPALGRTSK
jgi:hypothetical protein